jgi:hypothetical protein
MLDILAVLFILLICGNKVVEACNSNITEAELTGTHTRYTSLITTLDPLYGLLPERTFEVLYNTCGAGVRIYVIREWTDASDAHGTPVENGVMYHRVYIQLKRTTHDT